MELSACQIYLSTSSQTVMILQSLYQLYERLAADPSTEITSLGFAPQKISFRVVLKQDGGLFTIAPLFDAITKKPFVNLSVPAQKVRAGTKILPQFLCDKATYCLGFDPSSEKREGFEPHFDAFKKLHLQAETAINCHEYSIFCRFLENWTNEASERFLQENPGLLSKCINFGIFEIQGQPHPIHELKPVRDWWINQEPVPTTTGQCLVTGEYDKAIARLHPKIKGFASAVALVGVQKNTSYESYRLEQGDIAPSSENAAFKYATALNWMLDGKGRSKHRFYLADTTCVYWTSKPSIIEDTMFSFFSSGSNMNEEAQHEDQRLKIEIFLKSIRIGKSILTDLGEEPDETDFFIMGIEQPNPGRFAIRFFLRSTVTEFLSNLQSHHRDISIVREYESSNQGRSEQAELPTSKDLINQTAVRLSSGKLDYKTIPPLLAGALMRSIFEKRNYPEGLYSAVIRRIRADRTINYYRAAIIKGTLTRNHNQPISYMLDLENKDPAYLLGRLFATLEKTQTDALGDLNAGLRDKYYSSASATPASVFPRILRTYQHHLAKLEGGQKIHRERLVQEIMGHLNQFPNQLNLLSQGNFALGYYHQRKAFFTKKEPELNTDKPIN